MPKEKVECWTKPKANGGKYTTCVSKASGEQLRKKIKVDTSDAKKGKATKKPAKKPTFAKVIPAKPAKKPMKAKVIPAKKKKVLKGRTEINWEKDSETLWHARRLGGTYMVKGETFAKKDYVDKKFEKLYVDEKTGRVYDSAKGGKVEANKVGGVIKFKGKYGLNLEQSEKGNWYNKEEYKKDWWKQRQQHDYTTEGYRYNL